MRKKYRIKKNEEFQYIFKKGRSFANRQLVIYYTYAPEQIHFRVGISVGKRIGNAVMRNKIKRYIRESIHALENKIVSHINLIVVARQPTKHLGYHEIQKSLLHLLRKQKLLR